ncbi:MAG: T9SS type A sorting domain-containing protein [Dysgonamonadaceae bacterium]|jgi:hypothetical protein|nr:T9SS type A sorting domain-containing protein [Dysgonamonadaceae bacterium]
MAKQILNTIIIIVLLLAVLPAFSQDRQSKKQETATEIVVPEMSVKDNKLTLKNATKGKQLIIYTIIGNKVRQIEIKSSEEEHELKLQRGIYIFKLESIVKKIVIK